MVSRQTFLKEKISNLNFYNSYQEYFISLYNNLLYSCDSCDLHRLLL